MTLRPMKAIVAYFTVSGHTRAAAEAIAKALNADLERIEAAKPVPSSMLSLLLFGGFAASRKRSWAARPTSCKLSDYDLVAVGTPVWAWTLNPVVRGWLDANPIPPGTPYAAFATAGGPGGLKAFDEIAAIVGRPPIATTKISDADRKSGDDARLVERFLAEVRAASGNSSA